MKAKHHSTTETFDPSSISAGATLGGKIFIYAVNGLNILILILVVLALLKYLRK